MDDSIVWNETEGIPYADGNLYEGPDAVLNEIFARLGNEWENFKLVNIKLHEMTGNRVLATLWYHGKFLKTGTSIDAQAAHLCTLKVGKVKGFQYANTKRLADAIKE